MSDGELSEDEINELLASKAGDSTGLRNAVITDEHNQLLKAILADYKTGFSPDLVRKLALSKKLSGSKRTEPLTQDEINLLLRALNKKT